MLNVTADEDMLMSLAHQKYKSGDFRLALDHNKAVYERNPMRTYNLLLMGAIYYQVGYIESMYLSCFLLV